MNYQNKYDINGIKKELFERKDLLLLIEKKECTYHLFYILAQTSNIL
jgi:hypothetical protein